MTEFPSHAGPLIGWSSATLCHFGTLVDSATFVYLLTIGNSVTLSLAAP